MAKHRWIGANSGEGVARLSDVGGGKSWCLALVRGARAQAAKAFLSGPMLLADINEVFSYLFFCFVVHDLRLGLHETWYKTNMQRVHFISSPTHAESKSPHFHRVVNRTFDRQCTVFSTR